jgi:hypothetical protein
MNRRWHLGDIDTHSSASEGNGARAGSTGNTRFGASEHSRDARPNDMRRSPSGARRMSDIARKRPQTPLAPLSPARHIERPYTHTRYEGARDTAYDTVPMHKREGKRGANQYDESYDEQHANRESMSYNREVEEMDDDIKSIAIQVGKRKRNRRNIIALSAVSCAILLGVLSTYLFSGADVVVKPRYKDVAVSAEMVASENPAPGELGYELLTLSEEGQRNVSATGQEKVSTKATGNMTIRNSYSSARQRLVKNTRFESSNGKIFRISESVVIPGYTKNAQGTITPGSVTVKVIADGPGDSYNIASGSFTIPGLKGPQHDGITGITVDTMKGGFEGMKYIINEDELAKAKQELHLELREKLFQKLTSQKPNGFIFFDPSVSFVYSSLPSQEQSNPETITISEKAELMAPLFKKDLFAPYLASKTVAGYSGEPMRIDDTSKLIFSYPGTSTPIVKGKPVKFKLVGTTRLVWHYDTERLRKDLVSQPRSEYKHILAKHPAIDRATETTRPLWHRSFPSDIEKITITESFDLAQ